MKQAGLVTERRSIGEPPEKRTRRGLGAYFSRWHRRPVLLAGPTARDHLVDEFDRMAEVYDAHVQPFSRPIFDAGLASIFTRGS